MSDTEVQKVPIKFLADPGHFLALGCGSGLIRPAPGTWGTVLAVVLWWALLSGAGLAVYLGVILAAAAFGVWASGRTADALGVEDHSAIVWDEFVGLWIACIALPSGWLWLLAAFVLFRVFDILKPWPVGWLDRNIKGGWGIMLDDLAAGFLALVVIQLVAWGLSATGTI